MVTARNHFNYKVMVVTQFLSMVFHCFSDFFYTVNCRIFTIAKYFNALELISITLRNEKRKQIASTTHVNKIFSYEFSPYSVECAMASLIYIIFMSVRIPRYF